VDPAFERIAFCAFSSLGAMQTTLTESFFASLASSHIIGNNSQKLIFALALARVVLRLDETSFGIARTVVVQPRPAFSGLALNAGISVIAS
jgi:hypothetical protein